MSLSNFGNRGAPALMRQKMNVDVRFGPGKMMMVFPTQITYLEMPLDHAIATFQEILNRCIAERLKQAGDVGPVRS